MLISIALPPSDLSDTSVSQLVWSIILDCIRINDFFISRTHVWISYACYLIISKWKEYFMAELYFRPLNIDAC